MNNITADTVGMFNGMKVISNPMALVTAPVREHKQTGTQSDFYHERIQKKWNKRFGTKHVPGVYMMYQMGERILIAHPVIIEKLKELPTGSGVSEKRHPPKPDVGFNPSYGQSPLKDIYRPNGIIDLETSA